MVNAKPNGSTPVAQSIPGASGGGDVHSASETQIATDIPAIVKELIDLQRQRKHCIVIQSKLDRAMDQMIAFVAGYSMDAPEKDRKAAFVRAAAFRTRVEAYFKKHQDAPPPTNDSNSEAMLTDMVITSLKGRLAFDEMRQSKEADMVRLAKLLPVWPFVQQVRGLDAKGLAVIAAEAGYFDKDTKTWRCIGDYRTISGLWKRLGLAVINGERQQRKAGKEAAAEQGFSPSRRAEMYAFLSDTMFRAQWRAARDANGDNAEKSGLPIAVPAHPIGPYGEAYAKRRARTKAKNDAGEYAERAAKIAAAIRKSGKTPPPENLAGRLTAGHLHNDARRVMSKRLLLDLWLAWRGKTFDPAHVPTAPG